MLDYSFEAFAYDHDFVATLAQGTDGVKKVGHHFS